MEIKIKNKEIDYEMKFEKTSKDGLSFDVNDYWKIELALYHESFKFLFKPTVMIIFFLLSISALKYSIIAGHFLANEALKSFETSTNIEKETKQLEKTLNEIRKSGWASPKLFLVHDGENDMGEPISFNQEDKVERNHNNNHFSDISINKVPNSDEISINYSNIPTKECESLSLKTFKEEITKKIKINNNETINIDEISVSYISEGCSLDSNNISFIN
jgi:hypothetical protein